MPSFLELYDLADPVKQDEDNKKEKARNPESITDRAMSGLESTKRSAVLAGMAVADSTPEDLANVIVDGQKKALPKTKDAQEIDDNSAAAIKSYDESSGAGAVPAFANLAVRRLYEHATHPKETLRKVAENVSNSLPGLVGSVGGAAAGTAVGGPLGGLAGGIAAGTAAGVIPEFGSEFEQRVITKVRELGLDPADPAAVAHVVRDNLPEFREKALAKGVTTAAVDAVLTRLTFGLGSMGERALAKEVQAVGKQAAAGTITKADAVAALAGLEAKQAARSTLGQQVKRGSLQTGGEMVGESASEGAGRIATGDPFNAVEAIDEGVLAVGQGGVMAAGGQVTNKALGLTPYDSVGTSLEAAKVLAANAPETIADKIQTQVDKGDSPLSRAAQAANPALAPDEISLRAKDLEQQFREGGMMQHLRDSSPEMAEGALYAFALARNKAAPAEARTKALEELEAAMKAVQMRSLPGINQAWNDLGISTPAEDLSSQKAAHEAGQQWQYLGVTDPAEDRRSQKIDALGQQWQDVRSNLSVTGPSSFNPNIPIQQKGAGPAPFSETQGEADAAPTSPDSTASEGVPQGRDNAEAGLGSADGGGYGRNAEPGGAPAGAVGQSGQYPGQAPDPTVEGTNREPTTTQAVQAAQEGPQAPAARKSVEAPQVFTPAGDGPDANLPALVRRRKAQLAAMAADGFETVESRGNGFYLVNTKANTELKLDGMADAQRARKAIADFVQKQSNTAAASPNNDRLNPTDGQIAAGNYKKSDVIPMNGMKVVLENPRGSTRSGTGKDGKRWSNTMKHHYGEILGTEASDGDRLDTFIGTRPDSNRVFVIDQLNDDGTYDESKVMQGFMTEEDARTGYLSNYDKGWKGLGAITEMTPQQVIAWAKSDLAKKPAAEYAQRQTTGVSNDGRRGNEGSDQAGGSVAGDGPASGGRDADNTRPENQRAGYAADGLRGATAQQGGGGVSPAGDTLLSAKERVLASAAHATKNQAAIQRLDARSRERVSAANPRRMETHALDALLDVFAGLTGKRGIAISQPGGGDGAAYNGDFFVNVENPHMHVAWSIGHEFKHLTENNPGLKKLYDRLWSMIDSEAGKQTYFQYLWRTHSDMEAAYPKNMPYAQASAQHQERLKDEMIADFMGKRFNDKAWLTKLAAQKPNLFGEFIRDWLPLLDKLITALRGEKARMEYGPKNVDRYISQLEDAKKIAMEVATVWAERNPKLAQSTGADQSIQNSAKDLQAELDEAMSGQVSDTSIKAKGVLAEDAYPDLDWKADRSGYQETAMAPSEGGVHLQRLEMNEDLHNKDLWEASMSGTWVGPNMGEPDAKGTKNGIKAFLRRQVAAIDLRDRKFDLTSTVEPEKLTSLVQTWKAMHKLDGAHKYEPRKAYAKGLAEIARSMGVTNTHDVEVRRQDSELGGSEQTLAVIFTDQKTGATYSATLTQYRDGVPYLDANTLELGKSGLGGAFYQMAAEYAAARNLQLHPESAISGINSYRRTEQQISAALRTGRSNVMIPHRTQRVHGFDNKPMTQAKHDANLSRLLLAGMRNAQELIPSFNALRYNPETGVFTNSKGANMEAAIGKLLSAPDARAFGMGRSTLARSVMTNMALKGQLKEVESFAEPVLYSARDTAEQEYKAVEAQYKGTDGWMKAPDGSKTLLTERQWVQTRTPSFINWFGDWTKGDIWSRDDVSKAVGENGEPLIVYHGTDKGGFYTFQQPGGQKRGDLGIFTTSNPDMARSYVRKGRVQEMSAALTRDDLEVQGFEFQEGFSIQEKFYDTREEAEDDRDDGGEIIESVRVTAPDGYDIDGPRETHYRFTSMAQAVEAAAESYDGDGDKSTIYAAFINLRNPYETDFEGAMWSGIRDHQWTVVVGGDLQTDSTGKQYFSEDEARKLAKTFADPDDEYEGADYMVAADEHWETTDSAVRDGLSGGHDGTIIRSVVDNGGGYGYDMTPSDVFVANKPGQLKSADFNTGEFGGRDDIRYSAQDQTETEAFKRWFGNSKVVDADGKPLVVYHGTSESFSEFDPKKSGKNYPSTGGERGFFFTSSPGTASVYAEKGAYAYLNPDDAGSANFGDGTANIVPAYLSLQSPVVAETSQAADKYFDYNRDRLYARADKAGADGIIVNGKDRRMFVAFRQNQIKSSIGNSGDFDASNQDIRRSAQDRNYKLDLDKTTRAVGKYSGLSQAEKTAIEEGAKEFGLSPAKTSELMDTARMQKKRFPTAAGWAPIEVAGVKLKKDIDGNPRPGTESPKFQEIAYGFNVPPGAKRAPPKIDEAWMGKVTEKFGDLVDDLYQRADAGDKNAQTIIAHQTWYRNVAEILRREYGAQGDFLADLLGATSPNTPVDTNWRFSLEIMRRFVRGEFAPMMKKFVDYLDKGGKPSQFPSAAKVRQLSGKLYGMNSGNAMVAMADLWRNIEPGSAPKARNFALNLIGQSNMATIDVWAARMLRRAANQVRGADLPRIPPVAESGVSGVWNADVTGVTGAFGFGAEVMRRVAEQQQAKGRNITPPDLQAIAWFAEKELWGTKGWTTKMGEGGSFEENIEASPVERYLAGFSIQQGEKVPEKGDVSTAQARILATLTGDDSVVAARAHPTYGLYAGVIEHSFDTEWTVAKGQHDPSLVMAEISRLSKENGQYDMFVSRVVAPDENNPNARPGVEIYFKTKRDLKAAMPVLEQFTARGQDGFTMATDVRSKSGSEEFIGVRLQYVPEISMRWDEGLRKELLAPGGIEKVLAERAELLDDITRDVRLMDGVAYAETHKYDTVVVGKENYDEYIDRGASGADSQAGGKAWFGRPIRQGLEGAVARYEGQRGQDGAGRVPDAGGGLQSAQLSGRDTRPSGGSGSGDQQTIRGAIHYGKQAGLSYLSGSNSGTGIKGAEQERLSSQGVDPRIKRRVYFYLPVDGGIPQAEIGLGGNVYQADLDGIYNPVTAKHAIRGVGNDFESAVLDAGYKGYTDPEQGTIVVLNQDVPVKHIGGIGDHKVIQRRNERIIPKVETRQEGQELVRQPQGTQTLDLIRNQAAIKDAAPSFRMEYGYARVKQDQAQAADKVLADAGSTFQWGGVQNSARDLGFYSELSNQVSKSSMNQAPAGAWKLFIKALSQKGVKADEIEWTGVNDFLDLQTSKVSKQALMDYLDANGVRVEETVLSEDPQLGHWIPEDSDEEYGSEPTNPTKFSQYVVPGGENYREVLLTLPRVAAKEPLMMYKSGADIREKASVLIDAGFSPDGVKAAAKFTDDGGSVSGGLSMQDRIVAQGYGYTAAQKEAGQILRGLLSGHQKRVSSAVAESAKNNYKSSHWDQPNVLAHIRLDDRTDATGAKVLFVQEVQSDWGQQGKKAGFKQDVDQAAIESRMQAITSRLREIAKSGVDESPELQDEWNRLSNEKSKLTESLVRANDGVPTGPFVTKTEGWLNLALKRVMLLAVDGGYAKVAFANGEQNAARYDLSKQVDEIVWRKSDDGEKFDIAASKDGRAIPTKEALTLAEVEGLVGKEVAQKVVDGVGLKGESGEGHTYGILSGLNLKVGGEGMRTFYDKIVPQATNALLKKLGAGKVEMVDLTNRWAHGMEIADRDVVKLDQIGFSVTDTMREKVGAGMPLFSKRDLVNTPAFKKWYAGSNLYNEDGTPMVLYHGTNKDFTAFKSSKSGLTGAGVYLSPDPDVASGYDGDGKGGERLMPVYARGKFMGLDTWSKYVQNEGGWPQAKAKAESEGYAGVWDQKYEDAVNVWSPDGNIKSAIGNNGKFDGAKADIRHSKRDFVGRTNRTYTPEQLRAFANVGFEVEIPSLKERAKALWKDAGKKLAQGIVDQFAPVKEISKEAYGLLRLAKGASGAFETMLQGGRLKLTDGVYDFDETKKGGVLDRLLKPMQGEHHDFLRWVAANRAERLMGEDREHLFTQADIDAIKTLADGDTKFDYTLQHGPRAGQTTRNRAEVWGDSLITFNEFHENVMDMAEQSGLVDKEARKLWDHEFYVPFYRVSDENGVAGMNIKGGAVRQQAFKKLKGGTDALNSDLLDNTLMNWAHLLDASAKNRAAKATLEAAESVNIAISTTEETARQMGKATGNRNGVVWFMDEGKQHYYLVEDPFVLQAITSLEFSGMKGPMMNAMSAMKNMLTVGVTASPFFKVRNLIRDSIQVIGTGNISFNPAKNLSDGWKLTNPKHDMYFRMLAGGGTIHFGTMYEGSEARRVQALVESGVDRSTILGDEHQVQAFYRKYLEPAVTAYNELGNRGESINRAALYDQLIKQGVSHADASLQARDLMDFSMQGSFATVRFLTQIVPFLNARLQGMYKLGRGAKEDPKRMAYVTGAVVLASLGLLAAYGDDDDWRKREDWDRDNYWWFKFGGIAFRIPKPFEIGAIGTLAERSAELVFDDEMTGKHFRSRVLSLLGDNLAMNPVPQLVKPMLDVYANRNSFNGRPIETMGMDRLQSDYRFTGSTSMTARAASTAMNSVTGLIGKEALSPVQIDSLITGYFGWLGMFSVGVADVAARAATQEPTRPAPDLWRAATGGIISQLEGAPGKYVSSVYTQAQEIEKAYGTWKNLQKEGKTEEAQEFRAANADNIQKYRSVEAVKGALSKINQQIRAIERSDMDRDAKRAEINRLNARKDQFARRLAA